MKILARNTIRLYYALVDTEEDTYDEYGNLTGSPHLTYKDPVPARMTYGARTGGIALTAHGLEDNYDLQLMTDDMSCPINENSVLFVDSSPSYDAGGNPQYDYIVKKVAPSINSISIAIAKVKVS